VIDSQSVKAPAAKKRGFDAAKITGRKRHIAVDADGRLLMVNLTTADIAGSAGAQLILHAIRKRWLGSSICSPTAPTIAVNLWTRLTTSDDGGHHEETAPGMRRRASKDRKRTLSGRCGARERGS